MLYALCSMLYAICCKCILNPSFLYENHLLNPGGVCAGHGGRVPRSIDYDAQCPDHTPPTDTRIRGRQAVQMYDRYVCVCVYVLVC
jgi:hypothetical protein